MQFGRHLRELWELRLGLTASILLAVLAACWSVGKVGLFPPSIAPRQLEMASASTRALVDTPHSAVLDLGVDTYNMQAMTNRSLLVGNVMASAPVRSYIARRAHLPAQVIKVASPVTPDFPRQLSTASEPHTTDILKSPQEYRLSIQSNPTVPIVDVYAQAPDARTAAALANGAIDGMRDYLRDLGKAQAVPPDQRTSLEQLGRARGTVLDPGISVKVALLSFLLVFAMAGAAALFLARVRRGWRAQDGDDGGGPASHVSPPSSQTA